MSYELAREYAREAAGNCDWVDGDDDGMGWAFAAADAASDIWEPVVRTLMFCLDAAGINRDLLERIVKETLDMTAEAEDYNAGK